MKDEIVAEVRKHRMEHPRKFKGDLTKICEDLRSRQEASGHEVVVRGPKKTKPSKRSTKPAGGGK